MTNEAYILSYDGALNQDEQKDDTDLQIELRNVIDRTMQDMLDKRDNDRIREYKTPTTDAERAVDIEIKAVVSNLVLGLFKGLGHVASLQ